MPLSMTLAFLLSLTQAQDPKPEPKVEMPKAEVPKEKSPVDIWFEDGLRFKSRDGNYEGRLGGRFLAHYRDVFDRPQETVNAAPMRNVPDTIFVRQARIDLEGTLLKEWGFKVQVDFGSGLYNQSTPGTGPSNVSGTLRDGFVEWKKYKEFQVRLGQWLMPLSQEDYSSSRFIDFAERSVMNRLNPGRELSLMFFGTVLDGSLDWYAGVTNGQATLNDGGRAINDANDQKEAVAALRYRPFQNSGTDWLKGLRIGLSGSYGSVDNVSTTNFDLISTELSIMYADSIAGGTVLDGFRRRVVPQLSWPIGPFSLRGEYTYRVDEMLNGTPRDALRTHGWYLYTTYILTGEDKKPEDRIVPKGEWGAFEVGFRVANLHVDDMFTSGIFNQAGNTNSVYTYTFGVNWWVTRNVRFTVDLIREKYNDPVQFDTRAERMLMGMIVRGQIDF